MRINDPYCGRLVIGHGQIAAKLEDLGILPQLHSLATVLASI